MILLTLVAVASLSAVSAWNYYLQKFDADRWQHGGANSLMSPSDFRNQRQAMVDDLLDHYLVVGMRRVDVLTSLLGIPDSVAVANLILSSNQGDKTLARLTSGDDAYIIAYDSYTSASSVRNPTLLVLRYDGGDKLEQAYKLKLTALDLKIHGK